MKIGARDRRPSGKSFSELYFEDALLASELQRCGPKFVAKYNAHVFSQSYEDSAIAEIFSRIGAKSKAFIEIGAGDGNENTTRLLLMLGWKGLWVEGSRSHIEKITNGFREEIKGGHLKVCHESLTAEHAQQIVDSANLGDEIDFLSIDVDQNTSHIWRAISLRPRVVCVEYNPHFHPSVEFEVPYRPDGAWNGTNVFGASLKSLEKLGREKNMALVGCDLMGLNAYFVAQELVADHFAEPFTAEHHYQPPRYQFALGRRGHRRAVR
jgi:hypothetical protein